MQNKPAEKILPDAGMASGINSVKHLRRAWPNKDFTDDELVALDSLRVPALTVIPALNDDQKQFAAEYDRVEKLLTPETMPWLEDHEPEFCHGIGQFHSDEPDVEFRKPYKGITLTQIRAMVDSPAQVDKSKGPWLIPSGLKSRNFAEQKQMGIYRLLWADIDEPKATFAENVKTVSHRVLMGRNAEFYCTASATEARQKFRILVPLDKPLHYRDWSNGQYVFCMLLASVGIAPDLAATRSAQLCYLPNRGKFYQSISKRDGKNLDPLKDWAESLEGLEKERIRQTQERQQQQDEAKAAYEARAALRGPYEGPDVIGEFKARHSIEELLLQAGYDRKGNDWRHPNSESGSYSLSVKDGLAFSLSSSDPLYTGGAGSKALDVFGVYAALSHGGDMKKAVISAKEEMGGTK